MHECNDPTFCWNKFIDTGDPTYLTALYIGKQLHVLMIAYKFLKNREVAEDITQDVFLYLADRYKEIGKVKNFDSWLYVVTGSKCKDYLRRIKTERKYLSEHVHDPSASSVKLKHTLDTDQILDAIRELEGKDFSTILLKELDGKDNDQIAEELNTSKKRIVDRKSKAKQKLKKKLIVLGLL